MDKDIYQIAEQMILLNQKTYDISLPLVEDESIEIRQKMNYYIC